MDKETVKNVKVIDPLDKIVKADFTKDDVNIDEAFEMLEMIEKESVKSKELEAEHIIEELSKKYLDEKSIKNIDKSLSTLSSYFKKYNVENDDVKKLDSLGIDKIFAIAKFLLNNINSTINKITFKLKLTSDEYNLIVKVIERKTEYDGNEIFNVIKLYEDVLKDWSENVKKLPKNFNEFDVDISITNIVMLYHFLSKHKIKGFVKEFYTFAALLEKIGETNKLYNAYNVIKERLTDDFKLWTSAITEMDEERKKELKPEKQ